jgi:hypothetical protein
MASRRVLRGLVLVMALTAVLACPWTIASAVDHFPDVPSGHPYEEAIEALAVRGIVGGYADGTFGPDDPVVRMQFAKMIVLTIGRPVTAADACPFPDVPEGTAQNPLYPDHYVAVAAASVLTTGYPDGTFRPYDRITRYQVITMAVRAGGNKLKDPPVGWLGVLDYSDPTHGQNLRKAEYNGVTEGLQGLSASWDGSLDASRAECAQVLWNLWQIRIVKNEWTNPPAAGAPAPRGGHSMVFANQTGQAYLFGGMKQVNGLLYYSDETWSYQRQTYTWTELNPTGAVPSSRFGASMVWIPGISAAILFGGDPSTGGDDETWSFDPIAIAWTKLSPAGPVPAPRYGQAMVLEPVSHRIILFGGKSDPGQGFNDTWQYDPILGTWTELHPFGAVPGVRWNHSMVWMGSTGKILLFGGNGGGAAGLLDDTWVYDPVANTWTELAPAGPVPSARLGHAMAYHPSLDRVVLFGGWRGGVYLDDTWFFDPATGAWEEIEPRGLVPPGRSSHSMYYDPLGGVLVVFGGNGGTARLGDTWVFDPLE